MDTKALRGHMRVRLMGALLTGVMVASCTLDKQKAPDLAGPSGASTTISVTATPDHLTQDGVSQTVVTATVRDAAGKPMSGVNINWLVTASDGSQVEPAAQFTATDTQGHAATTVTAPAAPSQLPTSPVKLTIAAQAVGSDAIVSAPGFEKARTSVVVELVPPGGTLQPNRAPVAVFTIVPVTGNVLQSMTFDASATTDEGVICGDACTYRWDFGDITTDTGRVVNHSFTLPKTYTITLTVTDGRGGVASTTRPLAINGPAAPTALFTITPISSVVGTSATVNLDATSSTVGAGATIVQYAWTIDTDAAVIRTTPGFSTTLTGVGGHTINLTVTDNLGRTASKTSGYTVQ